MASIVSMVLVLTGVSSLVRAERVTLLDRQTAFQRLTVVEDTLRRERYLYSDDQRYLQGLISLRRPDDLHPDYLRSALLGLVFAPARPSAMLFVGLGAGSLPRYLSARYPHSRLDAVEIDPEVPPVARRYFELPAPHRLAVTVDDGREFIRRQTRKYDLVLLDAYFGAEIPPHLATLEFLDELRRILRPGGVVVANLPSPEVAANFWPVLATYRAGFAQLRVFATHSPVNVILVASSSADLWPDDATMRRKIRQLRKRHRIDVDLAALADLVPPWASAPIAASQLRDTPRR